jgi:acetyl esterase/lipase
VPDATSQCAREPTARDALSRSIVPCARSSRIADLLELLRMSPPFEGSLESRRVRYDESEFAFKLPADTLVTDVSARGVESQWLEPPGVPHDRFLLYLHGGGYVQGSCRSHRHLAAAIALSGGASALVPNYRRAPECRFPAAVDDAVSAFLYMLDRGVPARSIVVAGDSAGGGLAIACVIRLRDAGRALPAAIVCLSPWVDLTCRAVSYDTHATKDRVLRGFDLQTMARTYLGDAPAEDPLASPMRADLGGLPDLLIQVGSEEILLDDAVQLAERAAAAGVNTTLQVWERMIHVWQWYGPLLDEAQMAVAEIGAFLNARFSRVAV